MGDVRHGVDLLDFTETAAARRRRTTARLFLIGLRIESFLGCYYFNPLQTHFNRNTGFDQNASKCFTFVGQVHCGCNTVCVALS